MNPVVSSLRFLKLFIRFCSDTIAVFLTLGRKAEKQGLLIVKTDGIGDYFLFRPFLPVFKKYADEKGITVTLMCSEPVFSFSEKYDTAWIDYFLKLQSGRFGKDLFYRFSELIKIRQVAYSEVFLPVSSRNIYLNDLLIRAIRAERKTGIFSDHYNRYLPFGNRIGDRWFTHLKAIDFSRDQFEFTRLTRFTELVTQFSLDKINSLAEISLPGIRLDREKKSDYVLFHGASVKERRWSAENWISLFSSGKPSDIILIGGTEEMEQGLKIRSGLEKSGHKVNDLTGKTLLETVANYIRNCKILVTNESMAVHLAFLTRTNTVVISNGNHFLRFHPYPAGLTDRMRFVYPPGFKPDLFTSGKFDPGLNPVFTGLNINEVLPGQVLKEIRKLSGESDE